MVGLKAAPHRPFFELNLTPPQQFRGVPKGRGCRGSQEWVAGSPVLPAVTPHMFPRQKLCLLLPVLILNWVFSFLVVSWSLTAWCPPPPAMGYGVCEGLEAGGIKPRSTGRCNAGILRESVVCHTLRTAFLCSVWFRFFLPSFIPLYSLWGQQLYLGEQKGSSLRSVTGHRESPVLGAAPRLGGLLQGNTPRMGHSKCCLAHRLPSAAWVGAGHRAGGMEPCCPLATCFWS